MPALTFSAKKKTNNDPLQSARAVDANLAAQDEEVLPDKEADPSVHSVAGGAGRVSPAPAAGSESITPPPRGGNLADDLALMVARGKPVPGMCDDDILLAGNSASDNENGVEAVKHARAKDTHTMRKEGKEVSQKKQKRIRDTQTTDSDETDIAPVKKPRPNSSSKSKRTPGKGAASAKVIDVDEEDQRVTTSRHTSVNSSAIYRDWDGPLLDDMRREFQSIVIARDGIFLKKHSGHRMLNFKAVLLAAQSTLSSRDFRSFKDQMERALKETDKS